MTVDNIPLSKIILVTITTLKTHFSKEADILIVSKLKCYSLHITEY